MATILEPVFTSHFLQTKQIHVAYCSLHLPTDLRHSSQKRGKQHMTSKDKKEFKLSPFVLAAKIGETLKQQQQQMNITLHRFGIISKTKSERTIGVTYKGNGKREVERRKRQIAKGQLKLGKN
jgi:hypothetical protein